mmetsp:Transcript_51643/g.82368  ORF Transcript_51643/g.82368 Transcript_51643/m.82368 type:complete len:205 (+) Transcript_51643:35-649(+)
MHSLLDMAQVHHIRLHVGCLIIAFRRLCLFCLDSWLRLFTLFALLDFFHIVAVHFIDRQLVRLCNLLLFHKDAKVIGAFKVFAAVDSAIVFALLFLQLDAVKDAFFAVRSANKLHDAMTLKFAHFDCIANGDSNISTIDDIQSALNPRFMYKHAFVFAALKVSDIIDTAIVFAFVSFECDAIKHALFALDTPDKLDRTDESISC